EVGIDLFAVLGRRFVVGAGREAIARLFGLQLFRERRLGLLERRSHLPLEIFPAREVLLERLGAWRRHRHPAPLEREAGAALRVGLVLARELIQEILGFLQLAHRLFAQLREIGAAAAATAAPSVARAPRLSG